MPSSISYQRQWLKHSVSKLFMSVIGIAMANAIQAEVWAHAAAGNPLPKPADYALANYLMNRP